jgi:hypothetical protein
MDNENSEKPVLSDTADKAVKKIYHTPSIKLYGSINELVQGTSISGFDAGNDDNAGST